MNFSWNGEIRKNMLFIQSEFSWSSGRKKWGSFFSCSKMRCRTNVGRSRPETGFYSVVFVIFMCIFVVNSEKLQCKEQHILNTVSLEELYFNSCKIESQGMPLNQSVCTLWDFGINKAEYNDCKNLHFSQSTSNYVKGVRITPYLSNMYSAAQLNVTFDMQWKFLQYRIQIGEQAMLCHRLQLAPSVHHSASSSVSFACDGIFLSWAANRQAEMLLDVGKSESDITAHSHYLFKIPENKTRVDPSNRDISINDWIIFVVVEITRKPLLVVYWPTVPDRFGVTSYRVQVAGEEAVEVGPSSCSGGYCSYEYSAGYSAREVNFSVQPVHKDCEDSCFSLSPSISLEFSLPSYFMAMMIFVPILVLLVCCCSVFYFCCALPKDPPKVVVLHDATERNHNRVVRLLAEFLQEECGVLCLQPDKEIPRTESQNPIKWLNKALEEADVVLVVASPESIMDVRYSEYPSVLFDALPTIERWRACPAHNSAGRCLVAVPPYCTQENVLPGLRGLPQAAIPREMAWLQWMLYNHHCWLQPFMWMAKQYLQCCWCPGPVFAYRSGRGKRLEEAVEDAVAAHMLAERRPHTPLGSEVTDWTQWPQRGEENDNESRNYGEYPGNLNNYKLVPLEEGSVISEDRSRSAKTVVENGAINLNGLRM